MYFSGFELQPNISYYHYEVENFVKFIDSNKLFNNLQPNKLYLNYIPICKFVEEEEFLKVDEDFIKENNEVCSICLKKYVTGDFIKKIKCGHLFHINCVQTW
ncbi:RING-type domain-containing protein [Meloidogyne graminicola]|uniref:RING-type domain-containing protein n=1 Tax=Meloidogyne graminicola TaxID=189291 RepID=A0A8S9ZRI6_9BILA|nr:RING-type domain-containing protein [Meloidogyne graminicola]